jgi:hypothetical protein
VISTDLHAELNNEVFRLKKRYDTEFKDVCGFFDGLMKDVLKMKEEVLAKVSVNHSK